MPDQRVAAPDQPPTEAQAGGLEADTARSPAFPGCVSRVDGGTCVKWLDRLLGHGTELAGDSQIESIRSLLSDSTSHQTEPVLTAFGVPCHLDDDEVMRALGSEKASDLIEAIQDLEPCTEPQQRFIAMMLCDLGDWIRVGNRPSQSTINTYHKMVDLLEPYFSDESIERGPLDWGMPLEAAGIRDH